MSTSGVSNLSGVNALQDIKGVSLETLLFTVLAERQNLCDKEVRRTVEGMQSKNQLLSKISQAQANVTASKKQFPPDAKGTNLLDGYKQAKDLSKDKKAELDKVPADAQTDPALRLTQQEAVANKWADGPEKAGTLERIALAREALGAGFSTNTSYQNITSLVNGDISKDGLDVLEVKLKSQSDAIANETTLDQITMQSWLGKLTNVQNMISTLTKKFDDLAAGIIRNM